MAKHPEMQSETSDLHETFLRLWMPHEPGLRAFVRSCCPRAQEVDDVMLEVSVAALRKFLTLDGDAASGPWSCLIARYELLSARRRFARDRLVFSEDVVERRRQGTAGVTLRGKSGVAAVGRWRSAFSRV